jgi:hypothetical protein
VHGLEQLPHRPGAQEPLLELDDALQVRDQPLEEVEICGREARPPAPTQQREAGDVPRPAAQYGRDQVMEPARLQPLLVEARRRERRTSESTRTSPGPRATAFASSRASSPR